MKHQEQDVHPRSTENVRRFRSMYGCPPEDAAVAWNLIEQEPPEGIRKNRAMYKCMFRYFY